MGVNLPGRNVTIYLGLLGSLQLAFLWLYRERFGVILPALGLILMLVSLATWRRCWWGSRCSGTDGC